MVSGYCSRQPGNGNLSYFRILGNALFRILKSLGLNRIYPIHSLQDRNNLQKILPIKDRIDTRVETSSSAPTSSSFKSAVGYMRSGRHGHLGVNAQVSSLGGR